MEAKVYKRSFTFRISLIVSILVLFAIVVYAALESPSYLYTDYKVILIYSFLVFAVISFFRFKVIISDDFILIRDVRIRKILFHEINKIIFIDGKLFIYSNNTNISITTDLEKQKEVINLIINKIKENPTIIIHGDNDIAESYGLKVNN